MAASVKFQNAGAPRGYYSSPTHLNNVDRQFDLDVALWYGAIQHPKANEAGFLKRLFAVLYYGGIQFKTSAGVWYDWNAAFAGRAQPVPVAAALSHGARVLIQLPPTNNAANWRLKGATGLLLSGTFKEGMIKRQYFNKNKADPGDFTFWNWLNGFPSVCSNRVVSTHGLKYATQPQITTGGHKLYLAETKGLSAGTTSSEKHQHYAFNPALGGYNRPNPISGANAMGDGLDGHLYLLFFPPNDFRCGGLLVGCENAQYGIGSNRHTGAGHGSGGAANETSATGGYKWQALANLGLAPCPSGKEAAMFVDLTDAATLANVRTSAVNFTADMLDQSPLASGPAGNFSSLPTNDEWKAATPVASRSNRLKAIDAHLKNINADHPTLVNLDALIDRCGLWLAGCRAGRIGGAEATPAMENTVSALYLRAQNLRAAI